MKKLVLHTVGGNKLPVEVEVKVPWISDHEICSNAVKAFNNAGINDKVLWAEII